MLKVEALLKLVSSFVLASNAFDKKILLWELTSYVLLYGFMSPKYYSWKVFAWWSNLVNRCLFDINYRQLFWITLSQLICFTLHMIKTCWVAFHFKNYFVIIYLLEDEQELSLGMLIRLKRIYNFWVLHATFISLLHVFASFIYHFIAFSWTNLLTRCQVPVPVFCCFSFQKSCTGKVRGKIHEKSGSPNTSRRRSSPKLSQRGAATWARGPQARVPPDPCLEAACGPWPPPRVASSPT